MKKVLLPMLLLSVAAVVTPASANWFNNPYLGISRNVGSAPNPTPEDVRQMRQPIIVRDDATLLGALRALFGGRKTEPTQAQNTR